jgi:hypothetical protein
MNDVNCLNPFKKIDYKNESDYFLHGLYICQLFEFLLRLLLILSVSVVKKSIKTKQLFYEPIINENWSANDYFQRLLTYYPKNTNRSFYKNINQAINDRNNFVHNAFKLSSDSIFHPDQLDQKGLPRIPINKKSLKILVKWLDSFQKANEQIFLIFRRFFSKDLKDRIDKKFNIKYSPESTGE